MKLKPPTALSTAGSRWTGMECAHGFCSCIIAFTQLLIFRNTKAKDTFQFCERQGKRDRDGLLVSRGTPKCNWSFFAFFPLHASKTSLEVLRYILMMLELVGWNQSSTTAVAVEKPMIVTRLEGIERRGCHPLPLAFYRWRRNRHWCKLPVQRMSLRHCKYVHYYLPLSL